MSFSHLAHFAFVFDAYNTHSTMNPWKVSKKLALSPLLEENHPYAQAKSVLPSTLGSVFADRVSVVVSRRI
jgi:hypothetical protein